MTVYPSTYRKRLYEGGAGLAGNDVAILGVLAYLAQQAREDGWFTVTQKEIAKRAGVDRKVVVRRLPILERAGWIDVRTSARNGHYQASAYCLHVPERDTVRVPERDTVRVPERDTVRVPERDSLSTTQVQRLRSKSYGMLPTPRPSAAGAATSTPESKSNAPTSPSGVGAEPRTVEPPIPDEPVRHWRDNGPALQNPSAYLDQLGIRRRTRTRKDAP